MPKKAPQRSDYYQSVRGLRFLVRGYYDVQSARKIARSRNLPKATEQHVDEAVLAFLEADYDALQKREKGIGKEIERYLKTMPVYREVFEKKYTGLGFMMAAVILSENDITRQDTPSKLWAFCGYAPTPCDRCVACGDVVVNGKHRVNTKNGETKKTIKCLETRTVASSRSMGLADGKKTEANPEGGLPYNADLRTKMYVLGGNLIKAGTEYVCGECGAPTNKAGKHDDSESLCDAVAPVRSAGTWRKVYDDYKYRKATAGWGLSDGHRHNAAQRYMVKQLLREIWVDWRTFLGLSIREPYHVEKQGKPQHSS